MAESINQDPRVYLAAERTMLAWVRTGIAMMGFGFVVARFGLFLRELAEAKADVVIQRPVLSLWVGTTLVMLGVTANLYAVVHHVRFRKRFISGEPFTVPAIGPIALPTLALAALGIAMMVYLMTF